MDETLGIVVAAKNQASPTLKAVQAEAKNTGGAVKQIGAAAAAAAAATQAAFQRIATGARQATGHFRSVGDSVDRAHRPVKSFGDTVLSISKGLKIVSLALAVVLTTAKLFPNVFGKATESVRDYGGRVQEVLKPLRALVAALIPAALAAKGLQIALGALGKVTQGLHAGLQGGLNLSLAGLRVAGTAARGALSGLGNLLSGVLGQLRNLALGTGAAVTAAGAALATMGIQANQFRENTLAALQGMTKSRQLAEQLYQQFSHFADVTPFDDTEVVKAGQALMTFGFNAMKYLPLVGDAAAAMKVNLEQVVGVLAKLKMGSFDMIEAGAVGISRQDLEQKGIHFSASGEPKEREKLLGAGEAVLKEKFGGTMANASSGFDATSSTLVSNLRRLAQRATEALFGSLKKGFIAASDALNTILSNGRLVASLQVIFDSVGKAIEGAAKHLPEFVGWLEKVANSHGLRLFLVNVIALMQTVGETLGKVFGVDLKAAMDPTKVNEWFDALGKGVAYGINAVFGLGRVWMEIGKILQEFVRDSRDSLKDWSDDVGRMFKALFFGLQSSIQATAATMIQSAIAVLTAYNTIAKKFGLQTVDIAPLYKAQIETAADAKISAGRAEQQQIDQRHAAEERQARERRKDEADPHRHDPAWKRISDAYQGKDRDTSAQTQFWQTFDQRRAGATRFFFGGAEAAPVPGYPIPRAAMGRYPDQPAVTPGVTNVPSNVPPVPGMPGAAAPRAVPSGAAYQGLDTDALGNLINLFKARYENLQKYQPAQSEAFKLQQYLPALQELLRRSRSADPGESQADRFKREESAENVQGTVSELTTPEQVSRNGGSDAAGAGGRGPGAAAAAMAEQIRARIAWLQSQGRGSTERHTDAVRRRSEIAALQAQYQQIVQGAQGSSAGSAGTADDGTVSLLGGGTLRLPRGDAASFSAPSGGTGAAAGASADGLSGSPAVQVSRAGKALSITLNVMVRSEEEAERFVLDVMRKYAAPVLAGSPAF